MTHEDWYSVATIVAVLLGPVLAVIVTRFIDDSRADQYRKLEIFRTLMRTRKTPIVNDHVGALNLVEVEFIKHGDVIAAWKAYLANLGEPLPPIEQKDVYETAVRKRDSLLTKLISEIAKVLKIKIEQLDILEGNYIPQGWHDDDFEQRFTRRALMNVLTGRQPIRIKADQHENTQTLYPPPPETES